MANVRKLSDDGAQATVDGGYKDPHELKDVYGYGRSEADICVDIDTNEVKLRPTQGNGPVVDTGITTTAR